MRLTRLFLRNYRVFEEALELELPAGLVGIYGPNGAGKSFLVESVRFALWGKARTSNDDVRTTGINGDCIVEVEFEHEGHLYVVRRTLSGINSTMKAEAHANGAQVAEGARDVGRYVQSILGMDDAAFRASVFAEQKQIAAFSNQTPAKRRELVLRLLGITPLDAARDEARRDAKLARESHDRLRDVLPPLEQLRDDLAALEATAATAAATAAEAGSIEAAAKDRATAAERALDALDELRRAHDDLVAEGKAVRAEHDAAEATVAKLTVEQAELADAGNRLVALQPDVEGLPAAEAKLAQVDLVATAEAVLAALPAAAEAAEPDDAAAEAARLAAEQAGAAAAELGGRLQSATAEAARARQAASGSSALSGAADCPLCGQALGDAFEQVQDHRAREVAEADARVAALEVEVAAATTAAKAASKTATAAATALAGARTAWAAAEQVRARRATAEHALAEAIAALGAPPEPGAGIALRAEVARRKAAADECRRLEGRLERRVTVERELEDARSVVLDTKGRRETLLEKVKGLGFEPAAHEAARAERTAAREAAEAATRLAADARLAEGRARAAADAAAKALTDAEAQHARIADLADASRHLGRLADLLNAFRTNVVATIGPRLATEAAELFAELTDHEYDRLEVDPESWEIQVRDAGRLHGMDRFSGSETDLANLALRVAISEHVRFQSGGAVGLLVLDEVFGPLDDDRRERMLQALDRLRSRFRQVLVVTHANDVKEQLPSAIEVVKLPGRRATARVIAGI
jgi:DNA repair exonuclease SbcCD ATPase subunit